MVGIKHSVVATSPNDPTKEVSTTAWNGEHVIDDVSIPLSKLASNPIPTGVICMWSGLLANVPSGWSLCDGSSGTPDLRSKFILSVDASENPGAIGGVSSLTHSGTAVTSHPATATSQASAGATQRGTTASTLTLLVHTHNTPVLSHSVTQPSAHADSRPPFYKLAFIMKL